MVVLVCLFVMVTVFISLAGVACGPSSKQPSAHWTALLFTHKTKTSLSSPTNSTGHEEKKNNNSNNKQKPIGLLRCSRCKIVHYCSKEHKAQHWAIHKVSYCELLSNLLSNKGYCFQLQFLECTFVSGLSLV